ncbi:MAG: metalloregulator ArsR/SmtB family transcription factor [Thermoprotei archaeon]
MAEVCKVYERHSEKIARVKSTLPSDDVIRELANFFNAMGNPTRLKILLALLSEELCTCDLMGVTNLSVSAISHQLRILKDRKIVKYRREGRNVYYSLEDEHIKQILRIGLAHIKE